MNANESLPEVGEEEVRTFGDNLEVEIANRAKEIGIGGLTNEAARGIVDLVLERAAELFEAYAEQWQPGSAFRAYHVSHFIRGLKDDTDRFGPTPGRQGDPEDTST